ncbi:homoserine dehydrogenase [Companilactobacillus sp.]|jgi:homoserine dehydrogenase|uniref:homoserine dehydrogenase n=1 Tax=Companilactobacillus sp. TaxID=2767905 RepID=UPI0025C2B3E2|nr:homoserine dehydrogenase [Companilactobacillus sp.]MCH4008583.1 homoserine dehydrogenase [Companilactobacillus sp.]MCH4051238.1 homoserine dehydrogenase [Companilactobacillus sp.]MCH4076526.1 homoserine dehydrogenase [Companilactobacillus sp.]MCH4125101.1 homoserine dehydrogenase [Companilactobacillus sp.]MCH4131642.1 homoserine dehydrogenase [Companilactobacillus sp.]
MKVAILGFGTVGKGVYEIIKKANIQTQNLSVSHIFIRKSRERILPQMTPDIDEIVNDDQTDVVVEALGGIEPAHEFILKALNHGKHVITANKAVIAKYLKEFTDAADANNVKFYFEASVGGGIPWIQGLEKALRIDSVNSISGIFNGTSNFILDQMSRNGQSFSEVLSKAQELGYAEADPSADIDGIDVANKLCISADIAYNINIQDRSKLPVFGIRNIKSSDVKFFEKNGYSVKLIGQTHQKGNKFDYVVEPTLFLNHTLEANTPDNYNLISLNGDTIGKLDFFGQGAGMFPTANAVVQDLLDIKEEKDHLKRDFNNEMEYSPELTKNDYLVRSNENVASLFKDYAPSKKDDYLVIHQISTGEMHRIMKSILKVDHAAFMVSLPSNSSLAGDSSISKQEAVA